jgi:tRNA(His) 5'-end guanylyltransferase
MNKNLELSNRMKNYYEQVSKTKLMRKCPVAIRIDGCHFRTFTKNLNKPFDDIIIKTMQSTMKYLCANIQGCILGYTQSDEITLILTDYKNIDSDAWFDYEVEKLCSVSASMATLAFNQFFNENVSLYKFKAYDGISKYKDDITEKYIKNLDKAVENGAIFDARCFNIPKEEVTNLLYWRQDDASRNSIQMVGQANFSHKELHKKSRNDIQDILMTQKGINWNDFPTYQKRGSCCIKKEYAVNDNGEEVEVDCVTDVDEPVESVTFRSRWIIDTDIPLFRDENRNYIEKLL